MDDASRLSFLAKPTVATVKGAITEASVATWQNESQTLVNPPTGNGATFNVTKLPATQLNPNAPVYTATPTIHKSAGLHVSVEVKGEVKRRACIIGGARVLSEARA